MSEDPESWIWGRGQEFGQLIWESEQNTPSREKSISNVRGNYSYFTYSKYPSAEILGVDLSLEQPTMYAPGMVSKSPVLTFDQ